MSINYDEIANQEVKVSDDKLQAISDLAERQLKIQEWITEQEERLKQAKKNLLAVQCDKLPAAMKEAGVKSFVLEDGSSVEIDEDIKASITQKNKEWCFEWLREEGFGDIIKNEFKTTFGKGEGDKAEKLATFLIEHEQDFNQKESVHPQTLGAFVREQLKENDHPEEWEKRFGVYRMKVAKITRPKA